MQECAEQTGAAVARGASLQLVCRVYGGGWWPRWARSRVGCFHIVLAVYLRLYS